MGKKELAESNETLEPVALGAPSDRATLVRKALAMVERRIEDGKLNASLADLIRLLELCDERQPKQAAPEMVRVRWSDPEDE